MNFIKLTDSCSEHPVFINVDHIRYFFEYEDGGTTCIQLEGKDNWFVTESPTQVEAKIAKFKK